MFLIRRRGGSGSLLYGAHELLMSAVVVVTSASVHARAPDAGIFLGKDIVAVAGGCCNYRDL